MTRFRLTLKGRSSELFIEAESFLALQTALASMKLSENKIAEIISETLNSTTSPIPKRMDESHDTSNKVRQLSMTSIADSPPSIVAVKGTTQNIKALFDTSWGRKPRTVVEILSALEFNTIYDAAGNISSALNKLVTKRGYLKRIKTGDQWTFFRPPETSK